MFGNLGTTTGGKELLKLSQSIILLPLNKTYTWIPFLRWSSQSYSLKSIDKWLLPQLSPQWGVILLGPCRICFFNRPHFMIFPQICFSIKGFLPVLKDITKVIRPPQVTDSRYSYRYSYRCSSNSRPQIGNSPSPQVTDFFFPIICIWGRRLYNLMFV